jgi:hypothetical protein
MLNNITYYLIFGKPLILYGGLLTFLSFLFTALIAILNQKGVHKIPFKWHMVTAKIAIGLALIHASLGILAYF